MSTHDTTENAPHRPNDTHPTDRRVSTMERFARGAHALLSAGALAALVLTTTLSGDAAAQSGGKIVLKPGKIITVAGEDIQGGTIVIVDGRITAIGADVEVPWDAVVHEYPDLVAFPGWVESDSNRGMDRPNENIDVAPFLDVRDSIDPVNFYFEDSLRWGVTTINIQHGNSCVIGAQGAIVKPHGLTVAQMLVRPRSGIKMSASPKSGKSPATQAQALREAFGSLRRELQNLVQEKKDGNDRARREALYQGRDLEGEEAKGKKMKGKAWTVEGLELIPRVEIDEKLLPLLGIVEGDTPVFFDAESPMAVHVALSIARENGFLEKTTLVLGPSCWKAADEIKKAGVSVILSPQLVHEERDPVTGEEKETFVPKVFHDKGIPFALQSRNQAENSLSFQVASCIGLGLDRASAIAAATTTPARILGLEKRVGTLEKGKDGNVVLYSGDPLSIASHVEFVVIEGNLVYDRSKDVRNKFLLEGVTPPNTAPSDELEGGGDIHASENAGAAKDGKDGKGKNEEK